MASFTVKNVKDVSVFDNWPNWWPDKTHYASQHAVRLAQKVAFEKLLAKGASERAVEAFLAANKEVLSFIPFIYSTGHHAAWIYPKAYLRAPNSGVPGLIPDYVLAGANSDGISWFVLELKAPKERAFTRNGSRVYLSPAANQGICQLLGYMDVAARTQANLRDEMKLAGFREPRGVLMIGTEEETEDEKVREFKGAWNRANQKLQIRSYSSLLRIVESKLRDFNRLPTTAK
jgi:hypothetical protein